MPKPLIIASIEFASQIAAIRHCREILYRGEPGTEITADDVEFVEALLCARPDKTLDLRDHVVIRYVRDWQPPPVRRTQCFWAELDDGTRVDFSFVKAVRLIADGQMRLGHPA